MPDQASADAELLVAALRELVGDRGLRLGAEALPFLKDWREREQGSALAVVLPASTQEVSAVMAFCRERGLSVQPQGGNTGLCAGSIPLGGTPGILLSTARLKTIREMDTIGNVAVVEAGVTLSHLHDEAEARGRVFPLSLGSEGTAQIGGLLSTNAGGVGALRYGPIRDLTLGLEAVLPDGSLIQRLGGLRKDNRGYDWKHLLIGGEGTLGIITAAALKLMPKALDQAHACCAVPDPRAAVELYGRLRDRFDTAVHACELLSGTEIDVALSEIPELRLPFPATPAWSIILTLGDSDPGARLEVRLEEFLEGAVEEGLVEDAALPKNATEVEAIWRLRHSLSEANKRYGLGLVFDVSVRVSDVPDFIERSAAASRRLAPMATPLFVCHLGDGNVHLISMIRHDRRPPPEALETLVEALFEAVHDIAESLNGSFSAEHGIGRKLVAEMERRLAPAETRMMRLIKQALDPEGRMAPGVLFDPETLKAGERGPGRR